MRTAPIFFTTKSDLPKTDGEKTGLWGLGRRLRPLISRWARTFLLLPLLPTFQPVRCLFLLMNISRWIPGGHCVLWPPPHVPEIPLQGLNGGSPGELGGVLAGEGGQVCWGWKTDQGWRNSSEHPRNTARPGWSCSISGRWPPFVWSLLAYVPETRNSWVFTWPLFLHRISEYWLGVKNWRVKEYLEAWMQVLGVYCCGQLDTGRHWRGGRPGPA